MKSGEKVKRTDATGDLFYLVRSIHGSALWIDAAKCSGHLIELDAVVARALAADLLAFADETEGETT